MLLILLFITQLSNYVIINTSKSLQASLRYVNEPNVQRIGYSPKK